MLSLTVSTSHDLSCQSLGDFIASIILTGTGGTKGADTVQEVDLGAVKGVGRHVKAEVVTAQTDIDVAYQDALDNIRLKRNNVDESELPPQKGGVSEQQQKDIYVSHSVNQLRHS